MSSEQQTHDVGPFVAEESQTEVLGTPGMVATGLRAAVASSALRPAELDRVRAGVTETSRSRRGEAAGHLRRGDYVVDTRPLRHSPPDDPYTVRVQMPLYDGTVRVVAPHGAEWTVPVADLRRATPEQRSRFDALVPTPVRVP